MCFHWFEVCINCSGKKTFASLSATFFKGTRFVLMAGLFLPSPVGLTKKRWDSRRVGMIISSAHCRYSE